MAHAEKCPVCGGSGKVVVTPPWASRTTCIPEPTATCHGCGGLGWVTVQDPPQYGITGGSQEIKLKESHEE